jgi:hypothetical protein
MRCSEPGHLAVVAISASCGLPSLSLGRYPPQALGIRMAVNNFRPRKYEDHEIVDDDNKVVGHIRVKPSGILWAPSNSKLGYGVSLKQFSEWIEENGRF